ncbi:MAG: hypothetical protein AMXMBFR6_09070 [Betaproteobacteria bacterium]|nr:hypothetical protein [Rhodocyclaceae bacterium]
MRQKYSSYLTLASSAALAQGLLLAISPLITRLYGPEDVGGFGVILGLGALVGSVGTGRLEHAIPVARRGIDAIRIALLGAVLVALTSTLSIALISLVSAWGLVEDPDWQKFPLMAIPVIASSLAFFQLVNALLLRQHAYRSVGMNKIYQGGVTGLLQLLLGWAALGSSGLIWAQALGYLAGGWSGLHRSLFRWGRAIRRQGLCLRDTFSRYRRFPLVLAPAALFNLASQHFPVLALGYIYGLYEAGLYALVMRVCGAPLGLLGQAVSQVYASEFRTFLGGRDELLAQKYVAMLARLLGLGVIVVGALVLVMNLWGTWLFGARWANIGTVTSLLSMMLVMDFATTPVSMTLGYLGNGRTQLAWDVGRLVAVTCVVVAVRHLSLRFGQFLVLLAVVWSLSLLIHAWLTYRACRVAGAAKSALAGDRTA